MAYNEKLTSRLRERLSDLKPKEIGMMGGIVFMVNGKMCAGVIKDDLFCRLDPAVYETALKKKGCRPMEMSGKKASPGWVFVDEAGIKSKNDFEYWVNSALEFNSKAKPSKKKTNGVQRKNSGTHPRKTGRSKS